MRLRILTILSIALLISSCGTSRKASRSAAQPTPQHTEIRRNEAWSAPAQYPRKPLSDVETTQKKQGPVRPIIEFPESECQHVKLSRFNYLPGGGLVLSLDELHEEFCYPLQGRFISDYGMRNGRPHTGIDIKAVPKDTIRAAFPGVVRMSKDYSSYGNIVVLRHYQGFETLYAHNSKNLVKPNDVVEAGDPIALAGRTGRATTEHLHFEVRAAGEAIDPKLVVDPNKMELRTGWLFVSNNNGKVAASNSESGLTRAEEDAVASIAANETARAKALAESTVNGKPKGPSEPEAVYYRVQKGDTLSQIARKNNTTVNKICDLNKIKSTSLLQINQRLRVK